MLVLERRHVLGGAAVTEEIYPGFKYSVCSYVVSLLRPEVIRELELPKYDLEIIPLDSTFTPLPDGDYLFRCGDHAQNTPRDRPPFDHRRRSLRAIRPVDGADGHGGKAPARHDSAGADHVESQRSLSGLPGSATIFAVLGEKLLYDLTKLMTMSSADFLDEWFETDVLKATMSASGIIGTFMGPRSPGTAYVLLHHYMGELDGAFRSWGFARGGMGTISRVIADAARHTARKFEPKLPSIRCLIKNGRAYGVVLASGEEIHARSSSRASIPSARF